jgi:hypothetical protein
MIAQIILTGLLGSILLYAWTEHRRSFKKTAPLHTPVTSIT